MNDSDRQRREWNRDFQARLSEWDGAFGIDPEESFFQGWEEIGSPELPWDAFDPVLAWWMAELCRLAYTPDHIEVGRDKKERLPRRARILEERTPFEEIKSVHKSGNHASIYRFRDGRPGAIVCFRGSSKLRQWIMNTLIRPHGWRRFRREGEPEGGFVHSGFYVLLKRVWPLLLTELEDCPRPWIFTGHSLGGALANLASGVTEPDLVCSFGAPKVANELFHTLQESTEIWRIVNEADVVPRLPLPDLRQGDRVLTHGVAPKVLQPDGQWRDDFDREEEDRLPFSRAALHRELQRPPDWLTAHRMSEYCDRLRRRISAS
ncbi:MAG: lipase family protein [Verrucomicrobiales bacterium]|nr:lipase family protein [Verrucomicrobiales bacterium]